VDYSDGSLFTGHHVLAVLRPSPIDHRDATTSESPGASKTTARSLL
jgi:hypothetical protein